MSLINIVILGTLGMLVLATSIVAFVFIYQKKLIQRDLKIQKMQAEYQKDLLKATITAQEKERKRIAQDLHDDIGAMLSTIKLSVVGMLRKKELDENQLSRLQNTKELIDETVGNVRRLSRDLLPATLDEFGLVHAIEQLRQKIKDNTHLNVSFEHRVETPRMDRTIELALYRIIQEILNNIIKHAHAENIQLWMKQDQSHLEISITDDGNGLAQQLEPGMHNGKNIGLGLKNIESRLSMINARIEYLPGPGKGTKVVLSMGYLFESVN